VSYFKHPQALVESETIGDDTRIWAFAHVLPGARIGRDCNICDQTFIENDVVLGDRVTIKCGVQVWDGITLEDDVFVGPNATFTNDPLPRSRQRPPTYARTVVRKGASIGANATILPGLTIGEGAMVGAGAVVTRDVPAHCVVVGNPARVLRNPQARTEPSGTPVGLKVVTDERGSLSFGEVGNPLPFLPQRYFTVFDVPPGQTRGEHAHRKCHQFLVCVAGACVATLDNGLESTRIELAGPAVGLHVPPLTWVALSEFSPGAVLLVLASDLFSEADYIRQYGEFRRAVQGASP
jgi:UDP-2-acetamido-3-amino-2,3-dideoxy-glucuronate N-acetyltransferase